jgi:iron(II)-dependent oxidoreductase
VAPFSIARAAVTNAEFVCFVEDDGYSRRDLWSTRGWSWREAEGAMHPVYWQRSHESWYERRYDLVQRLSAESPVMHVNWYEAQAYCRWAGRRLPTEIEWEYAAAVDPRSPGRKNHFPWGDQPPDARRANLYGAADGPVAVHALHDGDTAVGCRQMIGNVWEWTDDAFGPYPGFVADPYAEYSQPWFRSHKVLRGGSHATRASLIRNTWRNFYTPERRDVFAGFRTCSA